MVKLDDRRREWLENLISLKKKKEEELKDLEEKKKQELEEAEEMLKASAEELSTEEVQILEQLREEIPELKELDEENAKKEETHEEINLEETVATERISEEASEQAGPAYEVPLEKTLAATQTIYERSDYNVYNELRETLNKAQRGEYLSRGERESFYKRQEEFERISTNKELIDEKDSFGYIERSKQVMDSISQTLHSQTQYKTGDHI